MSINTRAERLRACPSFLSFEIEVDVEQVPASERADEAVETLESDPHVDTASSERNELDEEREEERDETPGHDVEFRNVEIVERKPRADVDETRDVEELRRSREGEMKRRWGRGMSN